MGYILYQTSTHSTEKAESQMNKHPNIFAYIDYKNYLTDWRKAEKVIHPGLTHEYLCAALGQKNRSYFNDLEKGRKMIGAEVLDRLVKLLRLHGDEARYFRAIVGYGQRATPQEREYWFEQVVQLNNTPFIQLDKNAFAYFGGWQHACVRSLLDTIDTEGDCALISQRFYNRITERQARESIDLLLKMGLIGKNTAGHLKPTDKILTTGDNAKGGFIRRYLLANHDMFRTILEKDEPETHSSTLETLSVSPKGLERIMKRIKQFRSEIQSIVHKDENKATRVFQFAIHAYPVSRKD
jgi:uncharacterized protein (TIGR02147 family)